MTRIFSRSSLLTLVAALLLLAALLPVRCHAQDDLSDSLDEDAPITGLDSTSITDNQTHSDILDATHANLFGSALSPSDFSYTASTVSSSPNTSAAFDASSSIDTPATSGAHSETFTAGGAATVESSMTGRQNSTQAFGAGTMTAAFAGGGSRSAFTGLSTKLANTAQGFSGQGVARPPVTTGIGPTRTLVQTSSNEPAQGYIATDPVLTGQAETSVPSLQLGTDMPTPSSQATGAFLEEDSSSLSAQYEFDDGQTPPTASSLAAKPGTIIGQSPNYVASTTGFFDSTKGDAALPTEDSNSISSLVPLRSTDASSPFPAVSDGTVFGVTTGLHPSLTNLPKTPLQSSFRAFERRAQEERILHGMSISESAQIYRNDLREYQRNGGRPTRKSMVTEGQGDNLPPAFQTTFKQAIR